MQAHVKTLYVDIKILQVHMMTAKSACLQDCSALSHISTASNATAVAAAKNLSDVQMERAPDIEP